MSVYKCIIQKNFLLMPSRKLEKPKTFLAIGYYARESDCLLQNGLLSRRSDWTPRFCEKAGTRKYTGFVKVDKECEKI